MSAAHRGVTFSMLGLDSPVLRERHLRKLEKKRQKFARARLPTALIEAEIAWLTKEHRLRGKAETR